MLERIRLRGLPFDDVADTRAKYLGQLAEKAGAIRLAIRNAVDNETREQLQADLFVILEAEKLARGWRRP